MTAATAKQKRITATITEGLSASPNRSVDMENGVIKNVKLIGFESKNGRLYPPAVLKAAVHLYESAKVNINHPAGNDPGKPREYQDRFGVVRSARFVEQSGIHGDCHFNPEHRDAKQVCWDATNNPEALGFSHNALLQLGPTNKSGKQIIEQIISVRSMDLVADPATTVSLFESENTMEMDMETPAEMPAATGSDPKSAMKAAFRNMIVAAVDDESLDMKATMSKIKEIMKAQDKLMGGSMMASGGGDEPEEAEEQISLLKQQVEHYQKKERQAKLVESIDTELATAGLDKRNSQHVSELFAKQLLATESVEERIALIKDRAALIGASPRSVQTRDTKPVYQSSTVNSLEQIDSKAFARRLLTR